MASQKKLKEQSDRIEQILGVPPVIKGIDMDKYSQQPWKPSAAPVPIPKKFKMPDIPKYDGTTDPRDHMTAFTTGVKGNYLTKQEIESVLVKKFGETLTKAHLGAQKVEKRMEDIFKIKQGDSELLREFVDRFQRERMMLPHVPDNWAAMAFASNLNKKSSEATRRLKECLREFPATTWNDVYNRYSTKPRIEEDTISRSQKEEKDNSRYNRRSRNRELGLSSRFGNDRNSREIRDDDRNLKARFGGYNFNVSTSELVAVLRGMGDKAGAPKPPSPKRTVNVISGGEKINGVTYTAANKVSKITITHGKRVRHVVEEENITFDDIDADGVLTQHNDALVISLIVHDTNVKRDLINPGSYVNIILLRILYEMQAEEKLVPKAHTLSGFDNSSIVTKGEITLTTFVEWVVKDTKFQVVEMEMAYNMILGRPWIHEMDVVPSTLHQVINFHHHREYVKSMGINRHPGESTL
ncbi:uncharacterized protein [Nicotiana sylvestris]|uniref:uncharacterized protein n=1 Tax=Nicotiana sylvestris TaxID=4096 RepID=UPI00388C8E23